MKTKLLILLLSFSLVSQGQTDTTKQDTVKCLPVVHVLHGTALAFTFFYHASSHGFAQTVRELFTQPKKQPNE